MLDSPVILVLSGKQREFDCNYTMIDVSVRSLPVILSYSHSDNLSQWNFTEWTFEVRDAPKDYIVAFAAVLRLRAETIDWTNSQPLLSMTHSHFQEK